jgi:protein subunit release factor A
VLREFRTVGAQLKDLDRVASKCNFARKLVNEAKDEPHLNSAARAVEEMAREVQLLEARAAAGAAPAVDDVLVEIQAAGEGEHATAWIRELCAMYLGWAERRAYEATILAEAALPLTALLRMSGPGVRGFLTGEVGLHRRIEAQTRQAAYVRMQTFAGDEPGHLKLEGREVRRRPGTFVEKVVSQARARNDATGRAVELTGSVDPSELRKMAAAMVDAATPSGDEVRRYFFGRAARVEDPRTGASTPRIKDVMRGELELFIAAWMSRTVAASVG